MLIISIVISSTLLTAQSEVDSARQQWRALVAAELAVRQPLTKDFRNPDNRPQPKPTAAPQMPAPAAPRTPGDKAMVGVTVWKLRPSQASDPEGPRLKELRHGAPAGNTVPAAQLTPARVDLGSNFSGKDHLILAVSSTRTGYLYIWSRERYADGRVGPANLIFPTSRLKGGDNHIAAGRGMRIPDASDDPPVFELVRKPGQKTEEVIVVVAPKPLPGIREGVETPAARIEQWQRQWSSVIRHIDARDSSPMTNRELASFSGETTETVLPQRFYEFRAGIGSTLMVAVPLALVD